MGVLQSLCYKVGEAQVMQKWEKNLEKNMIGDVKLMYFPLYVN